MLVKTDQIKKWFFFNFNQNGINETDQSVYMLMRVEIEDMIAYWLILTLNVMFVYERYNAKHLIYY